jgi:hypothetical protein
MNDLRVEFSVEFSGPFDERQASEERASLILDAQSLSLLSRQLPGFSIVHRCPKSNVSVVESDPGKMATAGITAAVVVLDALRPILGQLYDRGK